MSTSASTPTTAPDTRAGPPLLSQAWRDLHWLIHSADLLTTTAELPLASWPATALNDIEQWLTQEILAPITLTGDTETQYRRLGLYAEALLRTALQQANSIELLAHHTPIHRSTGGAEPATRQTIGELDYIWRDRQNNQVWHWELAVKFYLYAPQATAGTDADRFVGLQQRDTLIRKITKLRDQQLRLSALPQVTQHIGIAVDNAAAYVKGWLFYPLGDQRWDNYILPQPAVLTMLNPLHAKGWWLSHADFIQRIQQQTMQEHSPVSETRWRILSRMQWLSPHQAVFSDTVDAPTLLAQLAAWFNAPTATTHPRPGLLIVALAPADQSTTATFDGIPAPVNTHQSAVTASTHATHAQTTADPIYTEVHRGFVVADGWPDALR